MSVILGIFVNFDLHYYLIFLNYNFVTSQYKSYVLLSEDIKHFQLLAYHQLYRNAQFDHSLFIFCIHYTFIYTCKYFCIIVFLLEVALIFWTRGLPKGSLVIALVFHTILVQSVSSHFSRRTALTIFFILCMKLDIDKW